MRIPGLTVPLCLTLFLSACSLLPQQQQKQENKDGEEKVVVPPPLHLGAVHQVYPERGFALLRMIGPVPSPGTTLITHPADGSNDRVGNLSVSNASGTRNGFIAADIRSGTVVKGDRVFLYREIAPPEAQEEDLTPQEPVAEGDDTVLPDESGIPAPATPTAPEAPAVAEPQQVDTTVLPEGDAGTPTLSNPETIPDSIRDVPDSINDWDNM